MPKFVLPPDADPRQKMEAFLVWVVAQLEHIEHVVEENNKLGRATYDMVYKVTQGPRAVVPHRPTKRAPVSPKIRKHAEGLAADLLDMLRETLRGDR